MIGTELLRVTTDALRQLDIPYMLTGSVAAAAYGAGRATMDIDLVVDPTLGQLRAFIGQLASPDRYISDEAAVDALRNRSMFNIIDTMTGWKVDLIIRKDRELSACEFARRQSIDFDGEPLFVATAEDVILSKLEWARLDSSDRQIADVAALLRVMAGSIDRTYVDRWVSSLGISRQWDRAAVAAFGAP